jgi:hypothetical protein
MKKTAILIASLILLTSFLYLLSQNASWERQVQQEVKQVKVLSSELYAHFPISAGENAPTLRLAYVRTK